jgi:hypothetical protein
MFAKLPPYSSISLPWIMRVFDGWDPAVKKIIDMDFVRSAKG